MFNWMWPTRKNWFGSLLNGLDPLTGERATEWRTGTFQQIGDTFYLDLGKGPSKKARVIDRIQFMQNGYPASAYPIRWATTISGANRTILANWNNKEQEAENFGDNIIIEFKHPEKVTSICITIIEPRPNNYWAVGDIRIREVRLFKKWWRVDIR